MEQDLIKEVKKMNNFLEAIDWKLWEIYKKMGADEHAKNAPAASLTDPESTAQVAGPIAITVPVVTEPAPVVAPVILVPAYPNIEKWK
jgi:hypothetical protein